MYRRDAISIPSGITKTRTEITETLELFYPLYIYIYIHTYIVYAVHRR